MPQKRFRLRFTFWLDLTKNDEAQLADTIDRLKSQRSFTQTIRDGIRLICDLRAGKLDVLHELFPFVFESFHTAIEQERSKIRAEYQRQSEGIEAKLTRLEKLLLEQTPQTMSTQPQNLHQSASLQGNFRPKQFDDVDEIEVTLTDSSDSFDNFLQSVFEI